LAPELVKALARFIDGVPALPVAEPRDAVAVSRGRAIFTNPAVGCATCHAGRLGTNNQNVDVGTGKAFQVAPLLGLAARAPYMHDGCAPTLLARFSDQRCGGDARHGATAELTAGQLADLVAYLETM
jgi:mono/diheme cytochrome c family protein